jgi:two-component system chemotaxis response regulator CheY
MPPEQALDSTNIDHRADIYSLGATLYYLLTGSPPYPGQTMMETLLKHRDAPIPALSAARQDIPTALEECVRHMLAKAAADRFQSMTEVIGVLEAVQAKLLDKAPELVLDHGSPTDVAAPNPDTIAPREPKETIAVPRAVSDHTMDLTALSAAPNVSLYVLLVEPSRAQARIIRKYMQSQEIRQIAAVTSGEEALEAVRTDRPDVVVSAMYLRDMTGVQLSQRLRAASPGSAPGFVLIHSETEYEEAGTVSKNGQVLTLQKPFSPEKLVEALSVVTGQPLAVFPTTPEQLGLTMVRPMMLGPLPPAGPPARKLDALRVLIVDDSKPARMHICNVLKEMGLRQFTEAKDGAEAVALLARDSFNLIITDYKMPLMDGRNLVAYLRQNPATAAVPIIMVTTVTEQDKLEDVRSLGVQAICDKNFPPEVVRGILDQLPNGSGA